VAATHADGKFNLGGRAGPAGEIIVIYGAGLGQTIGR